MKRTTFITIFISIMFALLVAPCSGQSVEPNAITIDPTFSVEGGIGLGATDEDLLRAAVLYWPNYAGDGGVGLAVLGGDPVPENDVAWGPTVEFPTGGIYQGAVNTLLPDAWAAAFGDMTAAIRPYGCASIYFDEDFNPIGEVGTVLRLFPNSTIQPALRTSYLTVSNNSELVGLDGWWTMFTVTVWF